MKLSLEVKMDILKAAMQEDRTEIRLIKDRINSICTLVTVSSFAVTSFLLDPKNILKPSIGWQFFLLIDVSFLLLLWALFVRLKIDLQNAHRCLEAREDMIRGIHKEESEGFDPFPRVDMQKKPRISENGLYWIVGVASLALILKLVVICALLLRH